MLSALIRSGRGYPAVHLAVQPADQRSVQHGPLVLVSEPRKSPAPTIDRDIEVPNHSVDMSSWEGSACYPRSTFYPLSDGPSIRNRRITKLQFPAWAACRPHSQAPFCLYTLRPVTNRPEGTFRSLRYAFGGDHPSQTTRQARSTHIGVLGSRQPKGRISTMTPRILAYTIHSLRPILHIGCPDTTLSCSKGSRGLFVPSRVIGIFTDTTISITPFVQVGTYPTRNFATLGPL